MPREQVVVLCDPFDARATRYAELALSVWGLRTVAVYTDVRGRSLRGARSPWLPREAAAAAYDAAGVPLPHLAAALRYRWDVVGVVPQDEAQVVRAAELNELLGIDWISPEVAARFRDKGSLKDFLRQQASVPRINATAMVRSVDDVRKARCSGEYSRYVIKPNDGFCNHGIGFFDESTSDEQIERFLEGKPAQLMEEFLDGTEYCVNGQLDEDGSALIEAVFRTEHVSANGRPQLASAFQSLRSDTGEFRSTATYAAALMEASGARRTPFHMELIVDDRGPCLVEVGARMTGGGMGFDMAVAHGGALDPFELALSHYLGLPPRRPQAPDWESYDATSIRTLFGVHTRRERVVHVDGLDEVEALPEFLQWHERPQLGRLVHPTLDMMTVPWMASFRGDDVAMLEEVDAQVRRTIRINPPTAAPVRVVRIVSASGAHVVRTGASVGRAALGRPEPLAQGAESPSSRLPFRRIAGIADLRRRVVRRVGETPVVRDAVVGSSVVGTLVDQFLGGETQDDAVRAVARLRDSGILPTVHLRLPPVHDADGAEDYVAGYLSLAEALSCAGLATGSEVSVKLEQLGLNAVGGRALATDNLQRVTAGAGAAGVLVTVDMQWYDEVQTTFDVVAEVRRTHSDLGVAVQAQLFRTEDDCRALAAAGARVRLVKGGLHPTPGTAFPSKAEVDKSYVRCLRALLEGDGYPMVATHDHRLIAIARALAIRAGRTPDDYEIQMQLGVREPLQRELVAEGERVRDYLAYGPEWYPWLIWLVGEKPTNLLRFARSTRLLQH